LGFESVGVVAVSYEECVALNLPVEPDPDPFPEHVVIDFSALEKREVERLAKKLKAHAESRDWLYRHPSNLP
jgi:DNA-directed RNA polymerase specialized sigma54-like protein